MAVSDTQNIFLTNTGQTSACGRGLETRVGTQNVVEHDNRLLASDLVGVLEELRDDRHCAELGEARSCAGAGGGWSFGRRVKGQTLW
jgi:hypothetical protein